MSAMTAPRIHMYVKRTIVQTANGWCRVYDVIDRARRPSLTDNQDQSHDGDFVQSLERGLSVIRAFDAEHPKLTLSEVAASTGRSRAAARRFRRPLVQLGYMRSDGSRFSLRPKILELGYAYLSSLTLPEVAMPHLEQLVEQVHESSSVCELDGNEVIYIARVPTKRIMTVTISVGTRFPAYATSMGRVLLAAQSDERLDDYLESGRLRGLTGHTDTHASAARAAQDPLPGLGPGGPGARGGAPVDRGSDPRRGRPGHRGHQRLDARRPAHVEQHRRGASAAAAPRRAPHRAGPGPLPRVGPRPPRRLTGAAL